MESNADEEPKFKHACKFCSKSFPVRRDLVKHQYIHRDNPIFPCVQCNKMFTTEVGYKRHMNANHKTKLKHACSNCGDSFRTMRQLEQHHEEEHRSKKCFRCNVCGSEFSWHENLLKHEQVHEVNPHVCQECSREFIDMTSLLVHRRMHHLKTEDPRSEQESSTLQESESDSKPYKCTICGRGFRFDFSYNAHMDAHVVQKSDVKSDIKLGTLSDSVGDGSRSVYVQMDSEGIIDVGSLNNTNNESMEIIVEVAPNISTDHEESQTTSVDKKSVIKSRNGNGAVGSSNNYTALKDYYDDQPPNLDRVDTPQPAETGYHHVPLRNKNMKAKKPKRERQPFQFNCVMTDDKPFSCEICGEAFRWEISLQIHLKVHAGGKLPGLRKMYTSGSNPSSAAQASVDPSVKKPGNIDKVTHITNKVAKISYDAGNKKIKKVPGKKTKKQKTGDVEEANVPGSRIVYRRQSSDEEDDEDDFLFQDESDKEEENIVQQEGKSYRQLTSENPSDLEQYLIGAGRRRPKKDSSRTSKGTNQGDIIENGTQQEGEEKIDADILNRSDLVIQMSTDQMEAQSNILHEGLVSGHSLGIVAGNDDGGIGNDTNVQMFYQVQDGIISSLNQQGGITVESCNAGLVEGNICLLSNAQNKLIDLSQFYVTDDQLAMAAAYQMSMPVVGEVAQNGFSGSGNESEIKDEKMDGNNFFAPAGMQGAPIIMFSDDGSQATPFSCGNASIISIVPVGRGITSEQVMIMNGQSAQNVIIGSLSSDEAQAGTILMSLANQYNQSNFGGFMSAQENYPTIISAAVGNSDDLPVACGHDELPRDCLSNVELCSTQFLTSTSGDDCQMTSSVQPQPETSCQPELRNRLQVAHSFWQKCNLNCMKRVLVCRICSKLFTDKRSVVMHSNRMHTSLKPVLSNNRSSAKQSSNSSSRSCLACGKTFSSIKLARRHRRRHGSVVSYSCQNCHKRYIKKTCLDQHLLLHNQAFGEQLKTGDGSNAQPVGCTFSTFESV